MQTEYYDGHKETVVLEEKDVPSAVAEALANRNVRRVAVKRLTSSQRRKAKRAALADLDAKP